MIVMLRAYFDDAGTHAGSPIAVMGGLIGTVAQWERLEEAWSKQLADPIPELEKPRLSMFHMAACEAADREFRDYKPVERQAVAQNFRKIIANSGLASTASAVDVAAWNDLVVGPARDYLGPAIEPGFAHCLTRARDFAWDHPEGRQIAVVFDQGIENSRLHKIVAMHTDFHDSRVEFCSIEFASVKCNYPLQAADIIATQNYWIAQNFMGLRAPGRDVDYSFRKLFADKPAEALLLDRQAIVEDLKHRGRDGRLLPVANILMTRGDR
jgi:hypothetical protein